MRTGTFTSPKEIEPDQIARGMGHEYPRSPAGKPSAASGGQGSKIILEEDRDRR
jgi:hypothetical protein